MSFPELMDELPLSGLGPHRFNSYMDIIDRSRTVVPAQECRVVMVRAGQYVSVIDLEGGQVGDVFAFASEGPLEFHSASHTRTHVSRLFPRPGEHFVTNLRRPILALVSDTSPGHHDMLIAACDPERYAALGAPGHASCAASLRSAMHDQGLPLGAVPQPINVFMNIPVDGRAGLSWLTAASSAGDAITFEALIDCYIAVSACPQDLNDINATLLQSNMSSKFRLDANTTSQGTGRDSGFTQLGRSKQLRTPISREPSGPTPVGTRQISLAVRKFENPARLGCSGNARSRGSQSQRKAARRSLCSAISMTPLPTGAAGAFGPLELFL